VKINDQIDHSQRFSNLLDDDDNIAIIDDEPD